MRTIPATLNDSLGFNLYRTALLFRREVTRALGGYELTPEQWQVMVALWSTEEPLSQNDLAALTLKDKHTISRILARLERDGWIERRAHARDARMLQVRATAWANERREAVPRDLVGRLDPIVAAFSPGERAELVRLLKRLRVLMGDDAA